MNEKEIIKYFKEVIIWYRENTPDRVYALNNKDVEMIQGLLDLYNKEKEKNEKAIEYINKNCSTNNCDFMDDGVGNLFKDILELLEERN